jgi:hypothetical protein
MKPSKQLTLGYSYAKKLVVYTREIKYALRIEEIEKESSRSYPVEESLCKRLWACRKAE